MQNAPPHFGTALQVLINTHVSFGLPESTGGVTARDKSYTGPCTSTTLLYAGDDRAEALL